MSANSPPHSKGYVPPYPAAVSPRWYFSQAMIRLDCGFPPETYHVSGGYTRVSLSNLCTKVAYTTKGREKNSHALDVSGGYKALLEDSLSIS